MNNKGSISQHLVSFYETDKFLIDSIADFISKGDLAIVVATKSHREDLDRELGTRKFKGQYILLDAEEILSTFMSEDLPDADLFEEAIEKLIRSARNSKRKIKIYGEMVAILWESGNHRAAILLEKLWNDYQSRNSFSLMCAYPSSALGVDVNLKQLSQICEEHSSVLPQDN